MSDTLGVQLKLTETSVLFQPAALAAGASSALISGAVFSMFKTTVEAAVLPA